MSQQCMRIFSTAFKESAVLRLGTGEGLAGGCAGARDRSQAALRVAGGLSEARPVRAEP